MEQEIIKQGWKRLTADTGNDYLYKAYPVKNMGEGLKIISSAASLAAAAGLDKNVHLSLDARTVTVSLNSPADIQLTDAHFQLAQQIDIR